eukprot:GEMP01004996.1.p1 GENE.GEMP01004996.1~~GEMP01004996.1.p1  ORF type:complete len:1064 (+),score=219.51 GEMP01004996.1:63-3254(+)
MQVSIDSCRRAAHMYEQAHLRLGCKPDTDPIEELRAHGALVLDLRLGTSASLEPIFSFLREGPCIHQLLLYSGEYFFGKENQYRQQISNHHRRYGKKNILEDSVMMRRLMASLSSFLGLRGSSLIVLDLTGIPFGEMELVTPLCRSLSSATQLNRIILANCKLGDIGFKSLIPILTNLRHLHAVSLANNGLTQPALVAQFLRTRLARGRSARTRTTPPLRSFSLVDLSGNPRLVKLGTKRRGNLLIRSICEVLRDGFALKRIVLNGLCLTSANLRPLMNLLSEVADGRIPRFVLEKVDLEGNPQISHELIALIDQALMSLLDARLNPQKWPTEPTLDRSRSLPQFETVGEPVFARVRRALSEGSDSDPELELPEDESAADFYRRKITLKNAFNGELRILTARMFQRSLRRHFRTDGYAASPYTFTANSHHSHNPGTPPSSIYTSDARPSPPPAPTRTRQPPWSLPPSESHMSKPPEVRPISEQARRFAARKASPSFHHDDPSTFYTAPDFENFGDPDTHTLHRVERRRIADCIDEDMGYEYTIRPETGAETICPESVITTLQPESLAGTLRPESATTTLRPASAAGTLRPESFGATLRPESAAGSMRPVSGAATVYPYEHMFTTAMPLPMTPPLPDVLAYGASPYIATSGTPPAPEVHQHRGRTSSYSPVPMTPPLPEAQHQGQHSPYAGVAMTPPFPDVRHHGYDPHYTTSPVTPPFPDARRYVNDPPFPPELAQQGEHISPHAADLMTPPFPEASPQEQLSPPRIPMTPPLPDDNARFPHQHLPNTPPQQQPQQQHQQVSYGHVTPPFSDDGIEGGTGRRGSPQADVVSPAVSSGRTGNDDMQYVTTVAAHVPTGGLDHYSSRSPPIPHDHPTYSSRTPPLPHDAVYSSHVPTITYSSRTPPATCSSRTPPATYSSRTPSYYDEDEQDANPFDRVQQQMAYRELNSKTPAPHHVGPLPPLEPARAFRDAMFRERTMHLPGGESSAVRSEPGPPSPHLAGMDDDSGGPSSRQRQHMGGSDYNFGTPTSSTSRTHSSESETTTVGWTVPRAVRVPNQHWYLRS